MDDVMDGVSRCRHCHQHLVNRYANDLMQSVWCTVEGDYVCEGEGSVALTHQPFDLPSTLTRTDVETWLSSD